MFLQPQCDRLLIWPITYHRAQASSPANQIIVFVRGCWQIYTNMKPSNMNKVTKIKENKTQGVL